jgi:hypothetical protein
MKKVLFIPLLFICYLSLAQAVDAPSIIGKPVILGNLQVAQNDFPFRMTWDDAKAACNKLGNEWRLPNKFELTTLYENRDKIGGFAGQNYWSSSEYYDLGAFYWDFISGLELNTGRSSEFFVRAVMGKEQTSPATDPASIIGTPFRVANLIVAQNDFPDRATWNDAILACSKLGKGWRLPTKIELNNLIQNKDKIKMKDSYYWSSTEYNKKQAFYQTFQSYVNGLQDYRTKETKFHFRAVKSF